MEGILGHSFSVLWFVTLFVWCLLGLGVWLFVTLLGLFGCLMLMSPVVWVFAVWGCFDVVWEVWIELVGYVLCNS